MRKLTDGQIEAHLHTYRQVAAGADLASERASSSDDGFDQFQSCQPLWR